MSIEHYSFNRLEDFALHLRAQRKKLHLLFAYNGTGKTRLSMSFKEAGKTPESADTLYYNAFTEDLFYWDNDLDGDTERVLRINNSSRFFQGLPELEMENRIRPLLGRYADFDFFIDYESWFVRFTRQDRRNDETVTHDFIKVSRGEENIFIWCFFLAVAQLAIDGQEAYNWVKYLYIDDPISSLDDNNAIAVAHHLAQMLKGDAVQVKAVISTHHALFFNVLCNEFGGAKKFFIRKTEDGYHLKSTTDSPFVYHVALVRGLKQAMDSGRLFSYHFNVLRTILEKAANFHGYSNFSQCIEIDDDDEDRTLHARIINIMNHGAYSLFEPVEMLPENQEYFRQVFNKYLANYKFNEALFAEENIQPIA